MGEHNKENLNETELVMQQLRAMLEREHALDIENAKGDSDRVPQQGADPSREGSAVAVKVHSEAPVPKEELEEEMDNGKKAGAVAEVEKTEVKPSPAPKAVGPRKKRRRLPKLTDESLQGEAPLEEAFAEKRKRAETLAREEAGDLYWNGTRASKASANAPDTPTTGDPAREGNKRPTASRGAQEPHADAAVASRRGEARAANEKQHEAFADLTVEGLLKDIFGPGVKGEHTWRDKAPAKSEKQVEPVEQEKTEERPTPQAPVQRPTEEDATLELDGTRIILPKEGTPIPEKPTQKRPPSEEGGETESVPLFSAFSVRRQKEGALPRPSLARRSAEQMAFKRAMEGSDEEFELLVDLDYEDELGEVMGFEKILDYHERRINGKGEAAAASSQGSRREHEYTAQTQSISLSKSYAKQRRRYAGNLVVTVILFVLLLVYEQSRAVLSLFGAARVGMKYPSLYIGVGLALLLCGVLLLRRHLIGGLVHLVRLSPSDYSFCSVVVLITLAYHACLFFVPAGGSMSLCLSPAMGNLCLLATAELFNWYREFSAFRVISSKQQKYALMSRVSVGNREGNARLRLFEQESREQRLYARPVGFVRNYFANTKKKADRQRAFGAELLIIAAICCVLTLFSLVMGASIGGAIHTAFFTFLFTVPAVSVLGTALPMFCATCLRLGRRGAIVGEQTVHSSGGKTTLVLPDTDCFKPMPHEQFELVKGCDAERATVYIQALLEKIESPLVDTVHVPKERCLSPDAITLTDVDEYGVAAVISGERKTPILMGSVAYLQKYGIRVSPKKDGRYEELCRHMICVAINNRLTALFIARYRLNDEMLPLVRLLEEEGLSLKIRSKDPGVHSEMLRDLFADAGLCPGVIKPLAAERDIDGQRVDATVVSLGSAREVVRTYAVCRRTRRAVRLGTVWQGLSVLCGALLSGALVLLGKITAVPTFVPVLFTLLWCGIHAIGTYFMLREN